jgi:hypothetical protein
LAKPHRKKVTGDILFYRIAKRFPLGENEHLQLADTTRMAFHQRKPVAAEIMEIEEGKLVDLRVTA